MPQSKKHQPLEDQVLSRMLAMPPHPKIASKKVKKKPAKNRAKKE